MDVKETGLHQYVILITAIELHDHHVSRETLWFDYSEKQFFWANEISKPGKQIFIANPIDIPMHDLVLSEQLHLERMDAHGVRKAHEDRCYHLSQRGYGHLQGKYKILVSTDKYQAENDRIYIGDDNGY